jgi:hypothetical protein
MIFRYGKLKITNLQYFICELLKIKLHHKFLNFKVCFIQSKSLQMVFLMIILFYLTR